MYAECVFVYVCVCVMYKLVYTAHTYASRVARTLAKSKAYTRAQQQRTLRRTNIHTFVYVACIGEKRWLR